MFKTITQSIVFLFRNLSCSGIHIRKQLRNYPGFIEALLLIIENVVGKQDIDCTVSLFRRNVLINLQLLHNLKIFLYKLVIRIFKTVNEMYKIFSNLIPTETQYNIFYDVILLNLNDNF